MPITTDSLYIPPPASRVSGMDIRSRKGAAAGPAPEKTAQSKGPDGSSSFSFRDLIDIVNPLHHFPVLGTIYRAISGDEIKAPARILGGGIFGGLAGAASGLLNTILDKATGKDLGEHLMALFNVGDTALTDGKTESDGSTPAQAMTAPISGTTASTGLNTSGLPEATYNLAKETAVTDPWERGIRNAGAPSSGEGGDPLTSARKTGGPALLAQALDHYDRAGRIRKHLPGEEKAPERRRLDLYY